MDQEEDQMEMHLLQDQNNNEYAPLYHLMYNRHYAAFRSLVKRALQKQPPSVDINYKLPHPVNKTFLDFAASENLREFVNFLLSETAADPNLINEDDNRAPIHYAAEKGSYEALAVLLSHRNIQPNLMAGGLTALHLAVAGNFQDCVKLLLEKSASPNIPNSRGLTAIHLAADKNNREMIKLIVDNTKVALILDKYSDRRKQTARMTINKKFPDIDLPADSENVDYADDLRYYLLANMPKEFSETIKKVKNFEDLDNKDELLKLAARQNLRGPLKELLSHESLDLTSLEKLGKIAVEEANPEILKEILNKSPKLADRLLLPASQELGISLKPGPNNKNNRLEIFKIILSKDDVDVRQEDDKGNCPLHYAARAECREAIEMLLEKGSYIGHPNSFGVPPLAHIAPGILEEHFDECLSSANERTEEFEITMDYQNFVPHSTECGTVDDLVLRKNSSSHNSANPCSETEALLYIAEHHHLRHLLKHPLVSSFLYLKYLRIKNVLLINFILYLIYFVLLMIFIWVLTSEAPEEENGDGKSIKPKNGGENEDPFVHWQNHAVLSSFLAIAAGYMVLRELFQFISSPFHYLMSPENWIELTLIGLTWALLFGAGREIGALAILLSTWELVVLIAQHPKMSVDIEMFKTVTVNFTKCFCLYVFLILAFAYAFFVLFKGDDSFPNAFGSLFKTIIMITGEFDSGELPFGGYPLLSRLIFVGFIFLIVIILLNLLNGLAVNDTGEILSEAELVTLKSRARLVAYAERIAVGAPFLPNPYSRFCCFINYLPFQSLTNKPMRFMARKILLFPRYMPEARLSVKPLKKNEVRLHGRSMSGKKYTTLKMDSIISKRAKEILEEKGRESEMEKIHNHINTLEKKLHTMQELLVEIRNAQINATENFENNEGFDME